MFGSMANKALFVKALRRSVKLLGSQEATGKAVGVDQATISRWLSGKVGWIPYHMPIAIEKATGGEVKATEFYPS